MMRNCGSTAEEDFRAVEAILGSDLPSFGVACFLAQQGAGKYLKAFLAAQGTEPARIHDLSLLVDECIRRDASLSALVRDCARLNRHAVGPRYPMESGLTDRGEAQNAKRAAERVRAAIRQRLGR